MRRTSRWLPLALIAALALFLAGFDFDSSRFRAGGSSGDELEDVIISFESLPSFALLGSIRGLGADVIHQYQSIPAVSARLPRAMVSQLLSLPGVANVEPDGKVLALETGPITSAQTLPWGIDRTNAPVVHSFDKGAGVKVAVIDTGIDLDHQDLNVAGGVSFVPGVASPDDDNGHGTHVAGTIAALDNSLGVLGMAPEASLYAVKVLNKNGSGTWSGVMAGIDWAVGNGIDVINMSLGASSAPSAVQSAIDAAYDAGVVIVAAAGNSGNQFGFGKNVTYPAKYSQVIAVAATDSGNNRASFSSTGNEVELAAPGVSVLSTTPGDSYSTFSGTSMASPHAAGLAALLLASGALADQDGDGDVDNEDVRLRMRDTTTDLGNPGRDALYGYGLINAEAAVTSGTPNVPPIADAGGPYSGAVGETITFDGSGSTDSDGSVVSYQWSFGDGATASGMTASHAYASGGVFTVTLTVGDNSGASDSDTTTATVAAGNQPPVANAGPNKTVTLGASVTLDGSGSFDPDGSIVSYDWDFGDGSSATGAVASHTYGSVGVYTATLTVTDNEGAADADTAAVNVVTSDDQTIHIDDVTVVIKKKFRGWKTWAEATVKVLDASGAPVSGVTVVGQWSGATSSAKSAVTKASGVASFRSRTLRRPSKGTTFTFAVTDLVKSGFTYDASSNVEDSDSATV